jgi:hypothetical protein
MTITDAIEHAKRIVAHAMEGIRESGSFMPHLEVYRADGACDIFGIDGHLMNSGRHKTALAISLRQKVADAETTAVFYLSDSFYGRHKTDDPQKIQAINKLIALFNLNVEESAQAGLLDKGEAIMLQVSLPNGDWAILQQEYIRNPDNKYDVAIAPGDPHVAQGTKAEAPVGRFCEWFKPPSTSELKVAADMGMALMTVDDYVHERKGY